MKVISDHRRAKQKEYNAKYRAANRERLRAADAEYRRLHARERSERGKINRRNDYEKDPEKWRERWRKAPPRVRTEKRKEWESQYYHKRSSDQQERLRRVLRSRLRDAIQNGRRAGSAVRDAGCSMEELVAHIESLWLDGMSWDNYGYRGWHIDHIRPLALFDLTDRGQFLAAVHYSNLQPLWAEDNLKKGKKGTL